MRISYPVACGLGAALFLGGVLTETALAAWPHDPNNGNVGICTAANDQPNPQIVSDGAGGAIVAWFDYRGGNADIYVQRVTKAGDIAPGWPANGVAACTAPGDQVYPTITADGSGGAVITWYDFRGGTWDIYAQRVAATGAIAGGWPVNGLAICTAANGQYNPTIVSDGAGGAIIAWFDLRSGNYDVYAQRVTGSGTIPGGWPANGLALCTAANNQYFPQIASDGVNGAIVTWFDLRAGNWDIYAQRVNSSGVIQWVANGVPLCTAASDQQYPTIVSDGAGGAIVTWYDARTGDNDIYAQRVGPTGVSQWTGNGAAVCVAASDQSNPVITTDGSGGAVIAWFDYRGGSSYDIYAQRMNAGGEPQWTPNGIPVSATTSDQLYPSILSDGQGGAIVAWYDYRSGSSYDIYAQRVNQGTYWWAYNGVQVCTAALNQYTPVLTSDGSGGAIVAWYDYRGGAGADIYAQRIEPFGYLGNPEPTIASVRDIPNDQGGQVKVSWNASYLDPILFSPIDSYWILRSAPPNLVAEAVRAGARVSADLSTEPLAGKRNFLALPAQANDYYWEFLASQPAFRVNTYSFVAATTADSVGGSNPRTAFMIMARNSNGTQYWFSPPDSGYSVDNLGPATPAPFTGQYNAGNTALHWNPNSEADLAGYRLYRGTTAGFIPGPGNLVVAQSDTGFVDVAGAPYYYKLTAVDLHGDESPPALLLPSGTTDVPSGGLGEIAFAAPAPNPSRTGVVLRVTLPREARVSLAVYDVNGARVRTLLAGSRTAGEHPIAWDLRSERGARVPAGLYFARLEVEGRTWTRRIAALE